VAGMFRGVLACLAIGCVCVLTNPRAVGVAGTQLTFMSASVFVLLYCFCTSKASKVYAGSRRYSTYFYICVSICAFVLVK
jgi:uncharacterized membrane protein YbaN (DUF454 family)